MATNQNQTRCEEKALGNPESPHLRIEVSGYRKVLLAFTEHGFLRQRWAYGQHLAGPVTGDGIRVAPHRAFYTDADAQAVADYVNQRVSP